MLGRVSMKKHYAESGRRQGKISDFFSIPANNTEMHPHHDTMTKSEDFCCVVSGLDSDLDRSRRLSPVKQTQEKGII